MRLIGVAVWAAAGLTIAISGAQARTPSFSQLKSSLIPMVFFVAKGDANSCGQGCDTWIAAEGHFDQDAAPRLQKLLDRLGNRNLPIYFNSEGGIVGAGIAVGEMLAARQMTSAVGRSQPLECRGKSKSACDQIKLADRELASRLQTSALCGSACIYALAGGVRRVIAADAILKVHSPRAFNVSGERWAEALALIERYMARMGISRELMKLTLSVPFERSRTLTRREIVQFGIEQREPLMVWRLFEIVSLREASIGFFRKTASGAGAMHVTLKLYCNARAMRAQYLVAGGDADAAEGNMVLMIGALTVRFTANGSAYYGGPKVFEAILSDAALRSLISADRIAMGIENDPASLSPVSQVGLDIALSKMRC